MEDQVISCEQALASLSGDVSLLREILDIFLVNAEEQLQELVQALAAGDLEAVRVLAQNLGDEAANFCGHRLSRTAQELEVLVGSGSQTGADELLDRLYREWEQLQLWVAEADWEEYTTRLAAM
jgi:HPt (histidine-containing phosphotransfer) domain-containing protein